MGQSLRASIQPSRANAGYQPGRTDPSVTLAVGTLFWPQSFRNSGVCRSLAIGVIQWVLIDVIRKPIRLLFEECPSVVVVRTMSIRGLDNGLLHRSEFVTRISIPEQIPIEAHRVVPIQPKVSVPHGDNLYFESVLPMPLETSRPKTRRSRQSPAQRYLGYNPPEPDEDTSSLGTNGIQPFSAEPYNVVTGYVDQVTNKSGAWRLNFIFNKGQQDTWLLSIQDETNSIMLLTVQLPIKDYKGSSLFKVHTPLRRFLQKQGEESANLWTALSNDDDEL